MFLPIVLPSYGTIVCFWSHCAGDGTGNRARNSWWQLYVCVCVCPWRTISRSLFLEISCFMNDCHWCSFETKYFTYMEGLFNRNHPWICRSSPLHRVIRDGHWIGESRRDPELYRPPHIPGYIPPHGGSWLKWIGALLIYGAQSAVLSHLGGQPNTPLTTSLYIFGHGSIWHFGTYSIYIYIYIYIIVFIHTPSSNWYTHLVIVWFEETVGVTMMMMLMMMKWWHHHHHHHAMWSDRTMIMTTWWWCIRQ